MTDLRKASEMALEALETLMLEKNSIYDRAIQALRQALVQPEEWKHCKHCGFQYRPPKEDKWHPLAQPEQEPVGYVTIENISSWAQVPSIKWFKKPTEGPLYTAPPKCEWVGLTEDEFESILEQHNEAFSFVIYQSIEAKLKEKNT